MNHIRRSLAHHASSPGTGEPHASQAQSQEPQLASRPGRDGLAGRFTKDLASAASAAAGQNQSAPAATASRRRTITVSGLLPRTIQLCIHCRRNPAGFWVSRDSGQTARRPWCLSCCQNLNPGRCHVQPFGS